MYIVPRTDVQHKIICKKIELKKKIDITLNC
jgi:hypothetical protein